MRRYGTIVMAVLLMSAMGLAVGVESADAAALVNPICSVSNPLAGATGVAYTYAFTTATSSSLTSVTMTVPSGTGGAPAVGTVSGIPGSVTVSLASTTLTYSFAATPVGAGTAATLQVTGLTNAPVGTYTWTITTYNVATSVDSGSGAPIALSTYALSNAIWSPSSTITGAGASYAYNFTTDATGGSLSTVTMTVPPGTGGSPAVGAVSGVPSGGSIGLASKHL